MKSICRNGILALPLLLGLSHGAQASTPTDPDLGEAVANFAPEQVLSDDHGQHRHWLAIGRVIVRKSHCSGSLIDTRDADGIQDGPAYVLTAGHCVYSDADRFIQNAPVSGRVIFNYFKDTQARQQTYSIVRIPWGTRRGGDIAIVELDRSLKQLMDDGITPLKLTRQPAAAGSNVLIVGAPQSSFLTRVACRQEASVDIFEEGFVWFDQLSNRCEGVRNGISGSPVLTRYGNEILGVIGTTTRIGGPSMCGADEPCEIRDGTPQKSPDTNYATPVTSLDRCFNAGRFTSDNVDCPLGPASDFEPRNDENYVRMLRNTEGGFDPLLWKQTFTSDQPFYRLKYTRTLADCANGEGYGPARQSKGKEQDTSTHALRAGPGFYFLCVMGQPHETVTVDRWSARNARVYWRWALAGPSNLAPVYTLFESKKNTFTVTPVEVAPDLTDAGYQYKIIPPQTSDCLNAEDYQRLGENQSAFIVTVADGPKRVCLKGHDIVGNPSPVVDFQLLESTDKNE
ncbi:trypsin-like peptidase domain-containing protein [Pseudomonas sp. TH08]|uniref:trypsin-like serine peptidase n=1 Tax=unclassified Pseudomonas TaxID=196821 RepID=UPI0019128817|nr:MULTISPECIES: trypsin-like peptidase domain-containing protein [unclassified Pseudomonas]MBK5528576.1 trypsin-like peptidase domain-containing protein [Pseudomonas sp. TH06]MBK5534217.1 trypsin-like peptidase domain-containing protein [Pseudomonas sp. TH08]